MQPNMSDVLITPTGTTSVRNSFLTDEQRAQLMIAASQGLSGRSCHKHERCALADKIGVNEGTVKNWLNNQRRKRKSSLNGFTTPQPPQRRKLKSEHYHSNSSSPLSGATSEDEDSMEPISLHHCQVKSEPFDDENNVTPSTSASTSSNSSINPSPSPSPHTTPRYPILPPLNHMIDVLSHIDHLLSHVGSQWIKSPDMSLQIQTLFAFHQHILSYTLPTQVLTHAKQQQQQQQPSLRQQPQESTSIAQSRPTRNIHPPTRFSDPLRMETMKRAITAPLPAHEKPSLHVVLPNETSSPLTVIRHDTQLAMSPHHMTPSTNSDNMSTCSSGSGSTTTSTDTLYGLPSLHTNHVTAYTQEASVAPFSHGMDTSSTMSSMTFDTSSTQFTSHMDTSSTHPSSYSSHLDTSSTHLDAISRAVAPTLSRPNSLLTRPPSLTRQTSLEFLNPSNVMGLHVDDTLF